MKRRGSQTRLVDHHFHLVGVEHGARQRQLKMLAHADRAAIGLPPALDRRHGDIAGRARPLLGKDRPRGQDKKGESEGSLHMNSMVHGSGFMVLGSWWAL